MGGGENYFSGFQQANAEATEAGACLITMIVLTDDRTIINGHNEF